MLLHSVSHLLLTDPEVNWFWFVKSEAEMEIGPGANNEEELGSAGVKFTKRTVTVQELAGQILECSMRNR